MTCSTVPEQYTLWKVHHVNPQERLTSDGTPVRSLQLCSHLRELASKHPKHDTQAEIHTEIHTEIHRRAYAAQGVGSS